MLTWSGGDVDARRRAQREGGRLEDAFEVRLQQELLENGSHIAILGGAFDVCDIPVDAFTFRQFSAHLPLL